MHGGEIDVTRLGVLLRDSFWIDPERVQTHEPGPAGRAVTEGFRPASGIAQRIVEDGDANVHRRTAGHHCDRSDSHRSAQSVHSANW